MKRIMYQNFHKGLVSDDMPECTDMYYAMYAYEQYGDATRDNTFEDLVELGRELDRNGGVE